MVWRSRWRKRSTILGGHWVKNNLQVIASLLRLQAEPEDNALSTALRESQNRVESMALIHEQLYQTGDCTG